MADYSEIGLNLFLNSTNAVSFAGTITSYNSGFDSGAIDAYSIKNFNFNAGSGGTLTLGGGDNANGYLRVLDSAGTQKVLINNEGIRVTDGSIVIENNLGSTIMDNKGLTTVNFRSYATSEFGSATQDGTTLSLMGGMSVSFEMDKDVNILAFFYDYGYNNDAGGGVNHSMTMYKSTDGTTYTAPSYSMSYDTYSNLLQPITGYWLFNVDGSGSYTYWKLDVEWKKNDGSGTAISLNRNLTYVVLGS